MGTAATATKIAGVDSVGCGLYRGYFTLALDTTDASGLMTVDLTSYFSKVFSVKLVGELAATANGYVVKVFKPAYSTALSSTNLILGFYEAGADGAELDAVASTDFSAVITGLTLEVDGKQLGNAS